MKESLLEKYNRWVNIDRSNLDEELSGNSSLLFHVGLKKVEAQKEMEKAKKMLSVISAKVDRKERSSGERITEKQMDAIKELHPSVRKAHSAYLDAQHTFGIYTVLHISMMDKSTHLTNLAYNYRKEMEYGSKRNINQLINKAKAANIAPFH